MGKRTEVQVTIPEQPPQEIRVEPPEENHTPEVVTERTIDHAADIAELRERVNTQEQRWGTWTESNEQMRSTLSQLSNNVQELSRTVTDQSRIPEVVMPLPVEETNEADNPLPEEQEDVPENPQKNTGNAQGMTPLRNAPPEGSKRRVLHKRR